MNSVISVTGLTVAYGDERPVVRDVSFALRAGEVLGIVGESGSGKTTVALSLMGYRPWNAGFSGSVEFEGEDMLLLPPARLRAMRGRRIAYVPQNPTTALNPARKIGALLNELLTVHKVTKSPSAARQRAISALSSFGFTDPESILSRYPHQMSGGQQQRIALAMATICDPSVVVLDEPTTGLDVSTQKTVLTLLVKLSRERQTAMIYVTHDLNVLTEIATHVGVLYAGQLVEVGPVRELFERPLHPYTRGLLESRPTIAKPPAAGSGLRGALKREELPAGCPFAPRCDLALPSCWQRAQNLIPLGPQHSVACERWDQKAVSRSALRRSSTDPQGSRPVLEVDDLSVVYRTAGTLSVFQSPPTRAVDRLTISVSPGEILAIVGESGSGKSTLAKAVAGLIPANSGRLQLAGEALALDVARRTPNQRRRLQLVFQNPDDSLNPRRRIGTILSEALRSFERLDKVTAEIRVRQSLTEVKLPESYAARFPDQLSGGERQRVAIARALIVNPDVLICDEVLSALDVSVQAGILDILRNLCQQRQLAVMFISHDLAVVRAVANRIAVLYRGEFVAYTTAHELLTPPIHPYLYELLGALPGETIAHAALPVTATAQTSRNHGCPFAARCRVRIDDVCTTLAPPWRGEDRRFKCHQTNDRLEELLTISSGGEYARPEKSHASTIS